MVTKKATTKPKKSGGLSRSEQLKRNICRQPKECHDIDCYDCGSRPFPRGKPNKFDNVKYDNNGVAINPPKGYRQPIPGSMGLVMIDRRRYKKEGVYWRK